MTSIAKLIIKFIDFDFYSFFFCKQSGSKRRGLIYNWRTIENDKNIFDPFLVLKISSRRRRTAFMEFYMQSMKSIVRNPYYGPREGRLIGRADSAVHALHVSLY